MSYLFTSESVSEGHPDKVADQISDAVLDKLLAYDPASHVACETLVTTGLAVVSGEVSSNTYVDLKTVARDTIRRIGYTKSEYQFDADGCAVLNAIQEQGYRQRSEPHQSIRSGSGRPGHHLRICYQ